MESGMDTRESCNGFGDELWGAEDSRQRMRTFTDGSDYTPEQLEALRRKTTLQKAPLPKGVLDVQWQPPESTGLEHSSPIFETEADSRGGLRLTSVGISASCSHFRSWQEDNGVARKFASETVEREVDGQRRIVSVCRGGPSTTTLLAMRASMTNADSPETHKVKMVGPLGTSAGTTNASPESATSGPSELGERPSTAPGGTDTSRCSGASETRVLTKGVPGPPLPSTDTSNQRTSPTPRRPPDSRASSHAQQPRPGRSLSTKEAVEDVSASASANEREEAGVVRCASPVKPSRGECERLSVATTVEEDTTTTTTVETTGMVCDPEIRGEEARMTSEQDGADDHEGETKTRHGGKEPSPSTPSPKVEETTKTSWWGSSRIPKASVREQPRNSSQDPSGIQPKEPAHHGELPPVSSATRSDGAPGPRRWWSFRRRTPRTVP